MTAAALQDTVKNLPGASGVYRMLDAQGTVLYVGKARDLKKRVASYFRGRLGSPRIAAMVQQVAQIEITVTETEDEALLLENNLIKSLRPRYNVLLRDDKSYPYIYVATEQPFPRFAFYRGARREPGRYFGPYPSASAVRESLGLLQRVFPVRQCEDGFFRNRSRPCLQYQIKRCTAPCVGLIDEARYGEDVRHAIMFLEGRSRAVIEEMARNMEQASARLDFEAAARYRDRISALRRLQDRQYMNGDGGDADVLAAAVQRERACVAVTFIRGGRNLGSKSFFPNVAGETDPAAVLGAFLPQYYLGKAIPPRIYLSHRVAEAGLLGQVFARQAGHRVAITPGGRGARRRWLDMAVINAQDALRRELASHANLQQRLEALQEALALEAMPERIECFDISHTLGEATVASCVAFDHNGPVKSDYRRFNIEGVAPGDDYGAMQQALTRRYRRVKEGEGRLPDLILIDGGKGQLAVALGVMQELQIEGVRLVGVAKGRERKPGLEQLFAGGEQPIILPPDSPALHLIQQVRDEAHRFAITGHRQRRGKRRTTSTLEEIPGIGAKRRQALLKSFGGLREMSRAGVDELARVPGISPALARRIYDLLHKQDA